MLLATACGGAGDGAAVFEQAQRGLPRVHEIRAHLVLDTLLPIERTVTLQASDLPLSRIHLARWAKHPHRYDCGAGLECARADLDVESAARDLEPSLPSLPFDPGSIDSAKVEIAIGRDDGLLRHGRLEGDLQGAHFTVDLDVPS